MPKPFTAIVEIEQAFVGEVLMRVRGMRGVVGVGFEDGRKAKPNGHDAPTVIRASRPRGVYDGTGQETVIEALFSKSPRTLDDLREVFIAQDRSPKSISSVLHEMIKEGDVVRGADGYRLSKGTRDRIRHRAVKKKTRR
jgi:hypothetical protein